MDLVTELKAAFPSCEPYISELERLRRETESIPFVGFFEPKVAICSKEGGPGALLVIDDATLTSWVAHVSCGTRARMRSLENAFVSELLAARLVSAMAMVRAHMETAAFSAYGLERAGACADSNQWDEMKAAGGAAGGSGGPAIFEKRRKSNQAPR
jgi:hypothetical protein